MQALRAVSTILVANRVLPSDVALAMLVAALLTGLQIASDLGIAPNVVQSKRGDEPRFLNTAFTMWRSAHGPVGAAAALAYPFARLYEDPRLLALVIAAAHRRPPQPGEPGGVDPVAARAGPDAHPAQRRQRAGGPCGRCCVGFDEAPRQRPWWPGRRLGRSPFAVGSYAIDRRLPRPAWDKLAVAS